MGWGYFAASVYDIARANYPMAVIWACYGLANFAWLVTYK